MTNTLLTGPPQIGKSTLVDKTVADAKEFLEQEVESISLGKIFSDLASRRWDTPPDRTRHIDYSYQELYFDVAVAEAGRQAALSKANHIIFDSPASVYIKGVVPYVIFDRHGIDILDESCGGLDLVVSLIDDAELLSQRLVGKNSPKEALKILEWLFYEAQIAQAVAPDTARKLVIPRMHSEQTLTKLLMDPKGPVGYLAHPIRRIAENSSDSPDVAKYKKGLRTRIGTFRDRFQAYSALLVPIIMGDIREGNFAEVQATEHRDRQVFIKHAGYSIAFFPDGDPKYGSSGVPDELKHTHVTGGFVILIHPDPKYKNGAFGLVPNLHFTNEDEFFKAVHTSHLRRYDNTPRAFLRQFMNERNPRYACLRH